MASPYQLFHRAERVERLSARIYAALAAQFRHDAEAHALFLRLEAEEEQHASRVRLLAAHYRNDPKKLPVHADPGALDGCVAECEQALSEIEAGAWGTDLAEVKARAAELEERLARAHAELLALNASPALREFFAQLAALDAAHVRLLA
jgi:hypothetical protein